MTESPAERAPVEHLRHLVFYLLRVQRLVGRGIRGSAVRVAGTCVDGLEDGVAGASESMGHGGEGVARGTGLVDAERGRPVPPREWCGEP